MTIIFELEDGIKIANSTLLSQGQNPLKDAEILVFEGSWNDKTYEEIASNSNYEYGYLKEIGRNLWERLSQVLGERVSKTNFKAALERKWRLQNTGVPANTNELVIKLIGNIEEIREQMEIVLGVLQQISGDQTLKIKIVKSGSIVMVLEGSLKGLRKLKSLFKTGELKDILGFPIEDVQLSSGIEDAISINLIYWLENNFNQALEAGWHTIEEVFSNTTLRPAFRTKAVKRARQIELGNRTLALVLDITPTENNEISVYLGILPTDGDSLPENIKFTIWQAEEILVEIPVGNVQELLFSPGEEFSIKIHLDDFSYEENFAI